MRALEDRFTPKSNRKQRQEFEAKRQEVSALLDKQGRKKLLRLVEPTRWHRRMQRWTVLLPASVLDIQKFYNKAKTKGRVKRYEGMKDLSLSAKTIRGLHAML